MKDFFISYNSADKNWAKWIAWQLEEAEYTTILQAWDFRPGHNFVLEMDKASKEAERTIVVLSPDFLSSSFAPSEWAVAFKKDPTGEKGLIVPVRVQKCELEGMLSTINRINLIGLDEEIAKKTLLDGVKFERAKPTTPPGFPGTRSVLVEPRFPGALPPYWNVPYHRNRNFTGRKSLLSNLHTALTSGQYAALTQAIIGLGGVGKTQLALEYVYSYMDKYEIVWWVRSEGLSTLAVDYVGLAEALHLPESNLADQNIVVDAVRRKLGQLKDWLLIFDNAQKYETIYAYLPQGGKGHVIITSRNQDWDVVAHEMPIDVFEEFEAIDFILKRAGENDPESAKELAKELGYLPLALEQACAYIKTGKSISGYLELFRQRKTDLLKFPISRKDYDYTVATTWEISFERVKEESGAGADLLNLCAFLAPDNIPKPLLIGGAEHLPEPLASAGADGLKLDDAVAALKRYSLMTVADDSLSVHRLVQTVTRDRLSDEERNGWAAAAVRLVNEAFPQESDDVRTWPECSILLPHALAAAGHAEELGAAPEATGRLLIQVGLYLRERAEFDDAKSAYERALWIGEKTYGPDHPNVAAAANNLGLVLQDQGDLEGAKKLYERALRIAEATYDPDHPNVATAANNLGLVLKARGDLEGARKLYERALRIDEKAYDPKHPKVARDINNLGSVLHDMGDLEGARKLYERGLRIDEKAYNPNYLKVARDINNLGTVLHDMGDLEGARKYLERALGIFKDKLGKDHPNTMKARNNLDVVEREIGGEG